MARSSVSVFMPDSISAVVRRPREEALAAVGCQTRPPEHLVTCDGSWHDAITAAAAAPGDWLWLVDGVVEPAPDALELLLGARAGAAELPPPSLLASRVITPEGVMHPASEPWIPLLDRVNVIAAARRRLTSLRLARWGSLLVSRTAVEAHGPPRADFAEAADDLEWTARLLGEGAGHGYLVPGSLAVSTRLARPPFSGAEARNRARMLRSSGWTGNEPVWFGFLLGLDALHALGRRRR